MSSNISEALSRQLFEAIRSSPHPYIFTFLDGGDGEAVRYTPAALLTAAMAYGEKLSSLLGARRRVLLCMDAGPECIVAIVAGVFHSITLVPLPLPRLRSEQQRLRNILERDGSDPILCDEKAARCFHGHDSLGGAVDILRVELQALETDAPCAGLEALPPAPLADHPVIIQYTSGSTGDPKGVVVTQRNLLANFQLVAKEWRFSPEKSVLSWLPHYHDMGLFGGILFPLLGGMQIVVMSPDDFIKKPSRWLTAIDRYRINYSGGPAFAFQLCCERIEEQALPGLDLSCWQIAFCGADYVPQRLLQGFRARFGVAGLVPQAVMACYGMAEYTLYVAGTRCWDEQDVSPLTLARSDCEGCHLAPGWEERIRVVPATGKTQADAGTPGKIYVSGESASPGYLTGELPGFVDGGRRWIDTGDLGFVRGSFLVVTGREKNMITLHGRNLMVHDLAASACAACDELNPLACVVFEHPEDHHLVMLIEGRGKSVVNGCIDTASMRQNVYRDFGVSLKEIRIVGRGHMPRTSSGKVQAGQTISRFMAATHD